jgi:preprotein translocase subunit YajC
MGLLYLALPLLLLWMVISRTRRQQRLLAAAQASVQPGMWAMTTSGLHGRVVSAGDEPTVLLEIAPGVHTRWARQAIAEVFEEDPATRATDPHPDDRDDRTHN